MIDGVVGRKRRSKYTCFFCSRVASISGLHLMNSAASRLLPKIAVRVRELAWRVADKLREADDVQHLEDILTVLMSEDAYKTANDRANALDAVIDKIGEIVNPRYATVIRTISKSNLLGFTARSSDHRNNAPGLMS